MSVRKSKDYFEDLIHVENERKEDRWRKVNELGSAQDKQEGR